MIENTSDCIYICNIVVGRYGLLIYKYNVPTENV